MENKKRILVRSAEDMALERIITEDMAEICDRKGGQDGLCESFPFSFMEESVVKEDKSYNSSTGITTYFKQVCIRSYALGGNGGVAIIDNRSYLCHGDNVSPYSKYECCGSTQQIVTLGEDDCFHFLNSKDVYSSCYNYGDDSGYFLGLLKMATKTYENYLKTRE